jgi:hypothetical protein
MLVHKVAQYYHLKTATVKYDIRNSKIAEGQQALTDLGNTMKLGSLQVVATRQDIKVYDEKEDDELRPVFTLLGC